MRRGAILLFALAACVDSRVVECSDGRICPAGTLCADDYNACITEEQRDVCAERGLTEGQRCVLPGVPGGICRDLEQDSSCDACVCLAALCGDGFLDSSEECEPGNAGARPDCTDHGFYDSAPVECLECRYDTSTCQRRCGDGLLDGDQGELCDGDAPLASCVDFGFDAGHLECQDGGCTPAFSTCLDIGWQLVVLDVASLGGSATFGDNVFVAGSVVADATERALLYHFDGIRWTRYDSGLDGHTTQVWAAAPDDAWMVDGTGAGTRLYHWDSFLWSAQTLPAADVVWGSAPDDVWVFGGDTLRRGDGTTWTATAVPQLGRALDVWGSGAGDVWVADADGQLLHFDGASWTDRTPPEVIPEHVIGFGVGDLLVAGTNGVTHWDGAQWTKLGIGRVVALAGASAADFYVAVTLSGIVSVQHWDGARWSIVRQGLLSADSLARNASGAVTLVRAPGRIERYGGSAWNDFDFDTSLPGPLRVAARGPDDAFLVEHDFIHRFPADSHEEYSLPGVRGLGIDDGEVYATGDAGAIWRWNPAITSWQPQPSAGTGILHRLAGAGDDRFVLSYDGSSATWSVLGSTAGGAWTERLAVPPDVTPTSLSCTEQGADACFVTGYGFPEDGHLWRADGPYFDWVELQFPGPAHSLYDAWVRAPDDIYMVGDRGLVVHYYGVGWAESHVPGFESNGYLVAVAGTDADDIFVMADDGSLFHWDGQYWGPVRPDLPLFYGSLWASDSTVWMAGSATDSGSGGVVRRLERTLPW